MKADKKDIFKKVIKLAADDQPAANFTGMVMQAIEADTEREAVLKTLLQQQPAEGPSFSFTANVMAQLKTNPSPVTYKPIITKKAWYGIAAGILMLLLVACLPGSGRPDIIWQNKMPDLLKLIGAIPQIYLTGIIIVSCLLFADYLITQRTTKSKTDTV